MPTVWDVIHSPLLLVQPRKLRGVFFAHAWASFGDIIDQGGADVKKPLLKNASGIVMDIGAGLCHSFSDG